MLLLLALLMPVGYHSLPANTIVVRASEHALQPSKKTLRWKPNDITLAAERYIESYEAVSSLHRHASRLCYSARHVPHRLLQCIIHRAFVLRIDLQRLQVKYILNSFTLTNCDNVFSFGCICIA